MGWKHTSRPLWVAMGEGPTSLLLLLSALPLFLYGYPQRSVGTDIKETL